jgi:hypothetical protein
VANFCASDERRAVGDPAGGCLRFGLDLLVRHDPCDQPLVLRFRGVEDALEQDFPAHWPPGGMSEPISA